MISLRNACLGVALLTPLTGCFPLSVADVALLMMSLPVVDGEGKIDLEGYTVGPTSSADFQALLASAIPAAEGTALISGRAQWSGLKSVKQRDWLQSVAVLTESAMLFLWWHESLERYQILIRLPYTDILSIEMKTPGLGAFIEICHDHTEIAIGDQAISIDRTTQFNFIHSVVGDREKSERAFAILDQKVAIPADMETSPDPCGAESNPDQEKVGFGEADLMGRGM